MEEENAKLQEELEAAKGADVARGEKSAVASVFLAAAPLLLALAALRM